MTVRFPSAAPALTALLLLLLPACAPAGAPGTAPVPAVAGTVSTLASIRLLNRLAADAATSTPAVTGLRVGRARALLVRRGLQVQVVALRPAARRVSAQWPEAAARLPPDGAVVIWRGRPPPPAAPSAAEPTPVATAPAPEPSPTPTPAAEAGPTPAPTPVRRSAPVPVATSPSPPPTPQPSDRGGPGPSSPGSTLPGRASWYGPGFAGRTTACGGTFDPGQLTLASREFGCGTSVRITGPAGSSVEAVVTDWGPAEWTGRRFDLSRATFEAISSLGAGVIDVTVELR